MVHEKVVYHYEVSVPTEKADFEIMSETWINENEVFIINGKHYIAKEVDDNFICAEDITTNAIAVYKVVKE